jgi:hypothetical protein
MMSNRSLKRYSLLAAMLLMLVLPRVVSAQDELTLVVTTNIACDQAEFNLEIFGGEAPYTVLVDFGDGEDFMDADAAGPSIELQHTYPGQGEYVWKVTVEDANGLIGESEGTIILDGPNVSISSDPFPPLLTIEEGEAGISFFADVSGGTPPYTLAWDLGGDGLPDDGQVGGTADFSYSEAGDYTAQVEVSDGCGFTASDTLTVVVVDPEDDPENACHPTAQKIAEAVSSIFPDRAQQTYTCKDIFDIFEGAVFGYHVGFGRMWHAYQLTQRIDELSWEDILDWQLNYSGWGILQQLDRFAGLLDSYGIGDLLTLVTSGEATVGEIRSAVRAVTRFDADFEDALARINAGATNGELAGLYKLAGELGVEPQALDIYLADGWTIPELNHAAKMAGRVNADWTEIIEAKSYNQSWGEIGQAYRLAGEEFTAADILVIGVKEFRAMGREQAQSTRQEARTEQTAVRLAEQYSVEPGVVLSLYNGDCGESWGCVRQALRDRPEAAGAITDRDERTAAKIASQYGYSEAEVWNVFESTCGHDWNCVRSYFRVLTRGAAGKGKNK